MPKKYIKVDENLYRGSVPSLLDLYKLKENGVTLIFDFRHKGFLGMKFLEKYMCKFLGISYKRMSCSFLCHQMPTLEEYKNVSDLVIKASQSNGNKSFLHCNSGTHRTGFMVAFYDLRKKWKIYIQPHN